MGLMGRMGRIGRMEISGRRRGVRERALNPCCGGGALEGGGKPPHSMRFAKSEETVEAVKGGVSALAHLDESGCRWDLAVFIMELTLGDFLRNQAASPNVESCFQRPELFIVAGPRAPLRSAPGWYN
jgi:hypothetical protein